MSIEKLAEELNTKYHLKISKSMISRWENNLTDPKSIYIHALCDFFEISTDQLIQTIEIPSSHVKITSIQVTSTEEDSNEKYSSNYNSSEINIIQKYRNLSEKGKEKVTDYVDMIYATESTHLDHNKGAEFPFSSIEESTPHLIINGRESAAGYGLIAEDAAAYLSEATNDIPPKANERLLIKGDSMEPLLSNGQSICIRHQPSIENGEIAIVSIHDELVTCKKVYTENSRIILRSINKKYSDMIFNHDEVRIIGKVLI